MRRRTTMAVVAAAAATVLLVAAASSGPVHVWRVPPRVASGAEPPDRSPAQAAKEPVAVESAERTVDERTLPQIVGVLLVVLAAVAIVAAVRAVDPPSWRDRVRRRRRGLHVTLPDGPDAPGRELVLDVGAARAALAEGSPRNAVVACWMQLERDAAEVGLPRLPAETSTEYAVRVVASASVDPGPIGQLAALYREARFSRHEVGEDHRARALSALERAAAELSRGVAVDA